MTAACPTWPEEDDVLTGFPEPGELVKLAYQDLETAATGTPEQARLLGAATALPRPWDPASCRHPRLLAELGEWLTQVASWLNHDLCWQPADMMPVCWRQHPALVRELALLADRRWRAETALTSELLEEWHRYTLPAFITRIHADGAGCLAGHRDWPGRARHDRQQQPQIEAARA